MASFGWLKCFSLPFNKQLTLHPVAIRIPEQTQSQFRPTRAHQASKANDFAFLDVEIDMLENISSQCGS